VGDEGKSPLMGKERIESLILQVRDGAFCLSNILKTSVYIFSKYGKIRLKQ